MKLFLKESSLNGLLNNTYYNETGKVVYKIHTPSHFGGVRGTTTLTRILSSPEDYSPDLMKHIHAESFRGIDNPSVEDDDEERTLEHGHDALQTNGANALIGDEDTIKHNDNLSHTSGPESSRSEVEPSTSASDGRSYRFEYIAQIDWHVVKSSRIRFSDGKEVLTKDYLRKETWGAYGRNRVFKASDGVEYRWIMGSSYSELVIHDSKKPIAKFHRRNYGILNKSKKAPAHLEIYREGEHIVDEIFVTFVYVEKLRMENETATASS